jgi:hypothetical protein
VADKYDPYREALVMETETVWPADLAPLSPAKKLQVEAALHGEPQHVAQLDYVRTHTGFCRKITVTQADVERVGGS